MTEENEEADLKFSKKFFKAKFFLSSQINV